MDFYLNFYAPSLKKNLNLKELTFRQFFTLNKFITNNNHAHISQCFDDIILDNLKEKEHFCQLTNFDKFVGLYLLRSSCISPEVELKSGTNAAKISLYPFLIKCVDKKVETNSTIIVNDIELQLNLPKSLYSSNTFDIIYDTIYNIKINKKNIDISALNVEEKNEIIEELPAQISAKVKAYCDEMEKQYSDLILEFKLLIDSKITINPFNNSLFEILKAFYQTDLISLYELQYILVNKLLYSAEYVDKNTLIENILLSNFYKAEIEKINAEQTKNLDKSTSLSK